MKKAKKWKNFKKIVKIKKKNYYNFFFCCCLEHKHIHTLHCKTQMRGAK